MVVGCFENVTIYDCGSTTDDCTLEDERCTWLSDSVSVHFQLLNNWDEVPVPVDIYNWQAVDRKCV